MYKIINHNENKSEQSKIDDIKHSTESLYQVQVVSDIENISGELKVTVHDDSNQEDILTSNILRLDVLRQCGKIYSKVQAKD